MKENNKKRWLAFGIFILVIILSIYSDINRGSNKESLNFTKEAFDKFADSYQEEVISGSNQFSKIKVINVDGVIASDPSNDQIVKSLKNAADDDTVAGVILNINSPGGSVYASERIYKEIKKLQKLKKPVYAVMRELAASGGYYISAPCDKIFASNETWTGSIGVIIQSYSLEGLFNKYGIKEQNITTGKMKDAGSYGSDMDTEEKEYFQGLVDSAFGRFVKVVAKGRDLSEKDVRKLADGRVYDGSQAVKNGLVDKIGDLDDAIKDMDTSYKLNDPMVIQEVDYLNNFSKLFPGFMLKKDPAKSDLQIIKEMMEKDGIKPMYLYGGYCEWKNYYK